MRLIMTILLAAIALNCLCLAYASSDYNSDIYDTVIPQECSTITVNIGNFRSQMQGFVIYPDLTNMYRTHCNTTVYLQTRQEYRLFVRFRKLRVDCNGRGAYVNIAGNTSSINYCATSTNWPALYSTANYLQITYYHGSFPPYSSNEAIEFYYTAFHNGYCNTRDDDEDDDDDDGPEFQCSNKRCIDARLKCDGFDNCGDWSDENINACGLPTGVIIAISVTSSIIGLAILACIVGCCVSKAKMRKNKTGATAETGQMTMAASPPQMAPMASLQCTLPAPPPYKQSSDGGNMYVGWAAPYDGLDVGAKPPQYDEISIGKTAKN